MSKQLKFEKQFYDDYCEWEDIITVNISDELQYRIDKARKLMESEGWINTIHIDMPDDFIDDETYDKMREQCPFDVAKILVYSFGVYLYIQSKWDARIQAEYGEVND